ncbi:tail fiber domain-containing protein, partial [Bacteroidia bacterium]|nr:tail fiber domain-containing protein [Bacteroidia bacterium]
MKNLYLIIFLFIGIAASAQSPEKMSYQAVIRDANGALLKSQNVNIQFTVNQTSASGTTLYQEYHTPTTNANGLVSTYVGTGTVSSGDFSAIDWSKGPYFLQTDIDPAGGTNYTISSTTEFVSVPFALYANKAEFADSLTGGVNETDPIFDASVAKGISTTDTAYWNGKLDRYTETDPVFDVSVAKGITTNNTTYWNNKLDSSSIQNFVDLTTNQTVGGEKEFSSDVTLANSNSLRWTSDDVRIEATTASDNMKFYVGNTEILKLEQANLAATFAGDLTVNGMTVGKSGGAVASNTAIGDSALYSNTTGYRNTANGYRALYSNTTGNNNTANGFSALTSNTTGRNNTANGKDALYSNTTGRGNTANGYQSLRTNNTGNNNTANGTSALFSNTTGNYNTAIGFEALTSTTSGSQNTAIGYYADVTVSNWSNATAIGNGAIVSLSGGVRIGNSSVRIIGGQVAWTNTSDGRIKENVQEAVPGLSFISELRPVTYTLNTRKQDEITMQAMPDSIKEKRMLSDADYLESSSIVRTGFIAQEVEAAAKKVGFDFDGVSTPENETDLYGIRYAEFVVPLVKAMQEQQEMITELKATE